MARIQEPQMPVPGYQEFMLPLVKLASDGQEHKITDAIDALADQFGVGKQDREIMLPSGTQTRLYNRVTWALTYLTKSLLLEKSARGRFRIAPRGADVLKNDPARIDNAFLQQFDEFRAFKQKRTKSATSVVAIDESGGDEVDTSLTPLERIEGGYNELREALADELLSRVRTMKPKAFEQLVVDVLVAMGYGGSQLDAAQVVGKSGDGGIDGVIKEDRLGLDMVYVQAKRHTNDVGPGAIREFVGSLGEHKATKGVFITCGGFTSGAIEAAAKAHHRIVLIDGDQLAEYMIDNGVGVADSKAYTVKKLDSDYFGEM
jgi:restriction system protein